jgi:hypothetical protein
MSLFRDWLNKIRQLSSEGYRSVTETQVYGQVEKLTNINHVEGNVYITSDQRVKDVALEELIAILEQRKNDILRMMDETQDQKVSSCSIFQTREEIISHLKTVRSLFLELHEKNIAALRNGQLMLSHELTSQIHALLWVREDGTFWDQFPYLDGVSYCMDPIAIEQKRYYFEATCNRYTELYPMSFPKISSDKAASSKEFSTLSKEFTREALKYRINEIHEHLLKRDTLNLKKYKKLEVERERREAKMRLEEAKRRAKQKEYERMAREEDERAKKRGVLVAEMIEDICTYWVICPYCGERFSIKHSMSWDGEKHIKCRTRLKLISKED